MRNLCNELLNVIFQGMPLYLRLPFRTTCQQWDTVIVYGNPLDSIHFELKKMKILDAVVKRRRNVFITGPGGAGKTATLNALFEEAIQHRLNIVMLAPTQMAAEHLPMGRTIHSFLRIKKTLNKDQIDFLLKDKVGRRKIASKDTPDVIVVDECSMFGSRLMYCMSRLLQAAYGSTLPFAGIQIVLCGDLYQLPPVCDSFCFTSPLWHKLDMLHFELTIPLRQSEDIRWFDMLQRIRVGIPKTVEDAGVHPRIYKDAGVLLDELVPRPVFLSSDNKVVEELNRREFAKNPNPIEMTLPAEDQFFRIERVEGVTYKSAITPPGNIALDTFWRCPQQLPIKVGGRYICTMNLDKEIGIINGRTCTYIGNETVKLDNGKVAHLSQFEALFDYMVGKDILLERRQLALRLGYAMTIHKSQGMTLDKVVCDLRTIRCTGSFYVALSRVRTVDDVYLVNVSKDQKIPISHDVTKFYHGHYAKN